MKTVDISGMGGGYEYTCQLMLKAGIEFLDKNPGEINFKQSEQFWGIIDTDDDPKAKALANHIAAASTDGCTGAMVQAVMGHLWFISKNGVENWLAEFKNRPERTYEWDGTEASCPRTSDEEPYSEEH